MTPYERQLQHSLDLLVYRDPSRNSLKNTDHDILTIFSGDEKAAREGLKVFHSRLSLNPNCEQFICVLSKFLDSHAMWNR